MAWSVFSFYSFLFKSGHYKCERKKSIHWPPFISLSLTWPNYLSYLSFIYYVGPWVNKEIAVSLWVLYLGVSHRLDTLIRNKRDNRNLLSSRGFHAQKKTQRTVLPPNKSHDRRLLISLPVKICWWNERWIVSPKRIGTQSAGLKDQANSWLTIPFSLSLIYFS